MKKLNFLFIVLFYVNSLAQVGINTSSPNASAVLDIVSDNSGILIPRVSLENILQTTPINSTPETSLLVWNTNSSIINGEGIGFYFWNGTEWVYLYNSINSPGSTPHNTLDMAYDQGGAGTGRTITADNGYVYINGTDGIRITGGNVNVVGNYLGATSGNQMFYYPRRGAFRAGNGSWNDLNPGDGSPGIGNIGTYSVALGFGNTASDDFSLALTNGASAENESAVAIGNGARAVQQDDVAIGQSAIANGTSATAMGESSEALGQSSIAIGSAAHSIGDESLALGKSCQAEALNSSAIGFGSQALGDESLAIGNGIRTDSYSEFSLGTNNTNGGGNSTSWVSTDRLLSIGNGATPTNRSNALVILKNGNIGIGADNPTTKLQVVGIPIYADNNAALAAGLTIGAFYHNGDGILRVVY